MSRRGENVYRRKDGRWEGRYVKGRSPAGKPVYGYLYAASYRELKEKMRQKGVFIPFGEEPPVGPDISFASLSLDWLDLTCVRVRESTGVKYANLVRNEIIPFLGEKNLSEITLEVLERFRNDLLIRGGVKETGLSPKTAADCLSLVRRILQYASERGFHPPCDGKSLTVRQPLGEMRILSRNEQQILCSYIYAHPHERNAGILLSLFTGIRLGELCALKWKDISFAEQSVYIHRTMQRLQIRESGGKRTRIIITEPKSARSIRRVPLPGELTEILREYRKRDEAYVLTGLETRYVEPRTMENHFHRILRQCGLSDANFHSLRHTFATRCVELGFDIKSLSEILGHASTTITMNRYVHPTMELKRENMMRLSPLIRER